MVPVKENQKRLYQAISNKVTAMEKDGTFQDLDGTEQITKAHGRIEHTSMRMITDTSFIYEELGLKSFYGSIAKIGIMDKKVIREKDGKEIEETSRSYTITDVEDLTVEDMFKIRRAHWNIEMQHWLLDMQLRENQKTARKGNATVNSSILRRFCLMARKYDEQLESKPMNRFLMSNEHDIHRIESLLFNKMQTQAIS